LTALHELIQQAKPLRTGATAVYPYSAKLEKKFQFTSRFGDEVSLCRVEGNVIHLPRAVCPIGVIDERVNGTVVNFPKAPTPKPNQYELFDATANFLLDGLSGIVQAYTGWGKTVLGYHAAYVTHRKTLVITTKDDIFKQWIEGAKQFLGLPDQMVGEIRGDKCEVEGTVFVVAMVQSLSKLGRYPAWIRDSFGLVIFDECHRMPAEQFSVVVDMFPAKLRLGLSATPSRADGKEIIAFAHIGPIRAATEAELMIPKVLRFKSEWKCPRTLKTDHETGEQEVVRIPHQPGKTTHIEKIIGKDKVRNHAIAELIKQAFDKGRKTVIFSTLHDHIHALHKSCLVDFKVSGKDMGFYVGAVTKAEQAAREREKVKPIVFTTFSMMSEGTSIDWLDTCLLAMPRSNVTQPVGRIRREYPDKLPPVVMEMIDEDSPVFNSYAASRLRWYKSIGCQVKDF
jgi:superfamily II DNA or RNA helicase